MPIDILDFREDQGGDVAKIRDSEKRRNHDASLVDAVLKADEGWRRAQGGLDLKQREFNAKTKEIGMFYRDKTKKALLKTDEGKSQVAALKEEAAARKKLIEVGEEDLKKATIERDHALYVIGNYVHPDVPVSNDEKDNRVERTWGVAEPREAYFKHHHELLWMIGGYEPERGAKLAGHRAYFLTGPGVQLNLALQQYALAFSVEKKYIPCYPPFFMDKEIMAKTAELADFDEQLYHVTGEKGDSEKYLIATSEQPISAMHMNDWIDPKDLPIKYAGLSTCFRKEAGSHGRDAWGIFRVHQFEKVEQFVYCAPDESADFHDELIKNAEEFYKSLKLPHQVISIVSGALNNAASKKYDLEAWFPGGDEVGGKYRELVSCSNCTDYQARAMETRLGTGKAKKHSKKEYCHMLNSTLVATTRTICCILENYQDEKGVHVPEVLQQYMGGLKFMPFVRKPPENKTKKKQQQAAAKKKGGKKK